jgi:hypothetical protein
VIDGNIGIGLWIAFIGWFLETAARAEVRRQEIRGMLAGHYAEEAMEPEHPGMIPGARARAVRPDSELWRVLKDMDRDGVAQLPVVSNGQVLGMLTREGIMRFMHKLRELGI